MVTHSIRVLFLFIAMTRLNYGCQEGIRRVVYYDESLTDFLVYDKKGERNKPQSHLSIRPN